MLHEKNDRKEKTNDSEAELEAIVIGTDLKKY